ncbi:MAG TPA: UDP-4-amino-4,6-dideoxy-N-acetyl-beta-L-altrosamine transaminase [Bryobacteraceae bacterium]|nr:UDP-4-amino-4,6-dideoxy-N-acetyl-beta-L-altrosamine transaminase [Bryobacteraceae bacterium]
MDPLPYGRHCIDEDDIREVVRTLRSDWLTTGPAVEEFERAFASYTGARHAVAVANGTAALHAAMFALGIGPGDEVIVPPLTFAATANCVVYQGATPVFADVVPDTLLLDPACVDKKITPRTKAIIAVDYAGQPCAYDALRGMARAHGLALVADACHALGATYKGRRAGALADLSTFSFHPVKPITTCEGGMVTTDDPDLARRMRIFRNHGITTDHRERAQSGTCFYEMTDLGYNYRLSEVQCALGISQLRKLPAWVARRQQIAQQYDRAFEAASAMRPLRTRAEVSHAYHLYVVRVVFGRDALISALRENGIGANVHYIPVHLHPYYRQRYQLRPGLCPVAEKAYEHIVSLPIFPQMTDADVSRVTSAVELICAVTCGQS